MDCSSSYRALHSLLPRVRQRWASHRHYRSRHPDANSLTISTKEQASSGVAVITVSSHAVPEVVRATTRLTNDENHTWRAGAVAEGRIEQVQANPGDVVEKGQLLAQMHSHEIHESRALYKRAKADLARAEGVEAYQAGVRDRAKRLLDLRRVPSPILITFGLLFATFQSAPQSLLILLNVPFALVAGIAALWIRHLNLNLSASVGFIALFGV